MSFISKVWKNKGNEDAQPITGNNLTDLENRIKNGFSTIVEYGSNENGVYVKFDNGLMFCWNDVTGNYNFDRVWREIYYAEIQMNFPLSFTQKPVIIPMASQQGCVTWTALSNYQSLSKNGVGIRVISNTDLQNQLLEITYFAIGFWK